MLVGRRSRLALSGVLFGIFAELGGGSMEQGWRPSREGMVGSDCIATNEACRPHPFRRFILFNQSINQ